MRSVLFSVVAVALWSVPTVSQAAEPAEEVLGKWVCKDSKDQPMEFLKDGKFKFGWTKDSGKWEMADGTFKIDKDGKIKASAGKGGVSLSMEFQLKDGTITGTLAGKNLKFTKEKEEKKDKDK